MVSRSNIEEANKHLHAMHLHSTYLENSLQECKEIIKQNEEKYCFQIQKLRKEKDDKITELTVRTKKAEEERHALENRLQEKESEIRLLKGRLSVFKQIFQFLPGLKTFVGVIENARQLVKDNDAVTDIIPKDLAIQEMNVPVPILAKHNLPGEKFRNLSVSDDSGDEMSDFHKPTPNGMIKNTAFNEKSAEVFL